jgi:hypothetical protein
MLAKVKRISYRVEPDTPHASPTRAFTLPEAFDLRFYFRHPQALAPDSAAVRLTVADAMGRRAEHTLRIPIRSHRSSSTSRCRSSFKALMFHSPEAGTSTQNRWAAARSVPTLLVPLHVRRDCLRLASARPDRAHGYPPRGVPLQE